MVEFTTTTKFRELERLLSSTIGPRKFWLHQACGGVDWKIINPHRHTKKVIICNNDELATFIQLKIK
jgi:hypothetical protein